MVRFIKGEIVVVPFPFSDLSQTKRRPAIVITDLTGDDLILCQITSESIFDKYAVSLSDDDFQKGSLKKKSNIRPN
jgi:mRNA interferase MazF